MNTYSFIKAASKFDPEKPARTREGRPAEFMAKSQIPSPEGFPLRFFVARAGYFWTTLNGEFYGPHRLSDWDLVNVTETVPSFDPSKPVQTRSGKPARIISLKGKAEAPITAIVNRTHGEAIFSYRTDGKLQSSESSLDLVNVPEKPPEKPPEITHVEVERIIWVFRHRATGKIFTRTREIGDAAPAHTGDQCRFELLGNSHIKFVQVVGPRYV